MKGNARLGLGKQKKRRAPLDELARRRREFKTPSNDEEEARVLSLDRVICHQRTWAAASSVRQWQPAHLHPLRPYDKVPPGHTQSGAVRRRSSLSPSMALVLLIHAGNILEFLLISF
jgi:hypothetical protein